MQRVAILAGALGHDDEQHRLQGLADTTADAMRKTMVNPETGLFVDNGNGTGTHCSWHSSAFPLWVGITAPGKATETAFNFLRQRRMVGSVYAAYAYLLALYKVDSDHGVSEH